ncbi:hypothetical protein D9M72_451210 [compost metagenome]
MRHAVFLAFKAYRLEDFRDRIPDDTAALSDDLHGEGNVREDILLRQQPEVLEHDADAPAQPRDPPAGNVRNVLAGNVDGAGCGPVFLEYQAKES